MESFGTGVGLYLRQQTLTQQKMTAKNAVATTEMERPCSRSLVSEICLGLATGGPTGLEFVGAALGVEGGNGEKSDVEFH